MMTKDFQITPLLQSFRALSKNPERFYHRYQTDKKKFGRPQLRSDGSKRKRDICAPICDLDAIQRKIVGVLQKIEVSNCLFGGVNNKNNVQNALHHSHNRYFFKIDLKNFFSYISNNQVHQCLIGAGFSWENARVLTRLTTLSGSLPQGAPTSPVLANLVFSPTASKLARFCQNRLITFTAFYDDLVFSSKKGFKSMLPEILKIITDDGFHPNNRKIQYRVNECEITGLYVGYNSVRFDEEMLNNRNNPYVNSYIRFVERQVDIYKVNWQGKKANQHTPKK